MGINGIGGMHASANAKSVSTVNEVGPWETGDAPATVTLTHGPKRDTFQSDFSSLVKAVQGGDISTAFWSIMSGGSWMRHQHRAIRVERAPVRCDVNLGHLQSRVDVNACIRPSRVAGAERSRCTLPGRAGRRHRRRTGSTWAARARRQVDRSSRRPRVSAGADSRPRARSWPRTSREQSVGGGRRGVPVADKHAGADDDPDR